MAGRGDGRLIRPNPNAAVKIGVSISTSSPVLDPTSTTPFYVVITAHVISSPRPDTPVTLMAHLNPFESLPNRSISNFRCTFPDSSSEKKIEIWPCSWPNYSAWPKNLRLMWPFITVFPHTPLVVKHVVERSKIEQAGLEKGEKYSVGLTNKALGTKWWTYGSLDDWDGWGFQRWKPEETRISEESDHDDDGREWEEGDGGFDDGKDGKIIRPAQSTLGEDPEELALVIEHSEAEVEIV